MPETVPRLKMRPRFDVGFDLHDEAHRGWIDVSVMGEASGLPEDGALGIPTGVIARSGIRVARVGAQAEGLGELLL